MSKPTERIVSTLAMALLAISALIVVGCDKSTETTSSDDARQASRLIDASSEKFPLTSSEAQSAYDAGAAQSDMPTEAQAKASANRVAERMISEIHDGYDPMKAIEEIKAIDQSYKAGNTSDLEHGEKVARIIETNKKIIEASKALERSYNNFASLSKENRAKKLNAARAVAKASLSKADPENPGQRVAANISLATIELIEARDSKRDLMISQLDMQEYLIGITILSGKISGFEMQKNAAEQVRPGDAIAIQNDFLIKVIEKNNKAGLELKVFKQDQEISNARVAELMKKANELDKQYIKMIQKAEEMQDPERFELETKAYGLRIGSEGIIATEKLIELANNDLDVVERKIALKQSIFDRDAKLIEDIEQTIAKLSDSKETTTDIDKRVAMANSSQQELAQDMDVLIGKLLGSHQSCVGDIEKVGSSYQNAMDAYGKAGHEANGKKMQDFISNEAASMFMNQVEYYDALLGTLDALSGAIAISGDTITPILDSFSKHAEMLMEKADAYTVEVVEEEATDMSGMGGMDSGMGMGMDMGDMGGTMPE